MKVQIELPKKLIPVFSGKADVRGAYGGRGSGKTRTFAKMTAIKIHIWDQAGRKGVVVCGRQFQNSLEDSSLEEIKLAIESEPWLAAYFDIGENYVRTKSGNIRYVFTGLDRNIESIKSKARILLCWVDEAEAVTENAWQTLIPTIREEDSELWVTWNPKRKGSATDHRFRNTEDDLYKVVELNWKDNPKFPAKLERERVRDIENNPEDYEHVWEGAYKTIYKGAYYAKHIAKAKTEGRFGTESKPLFVPEDPYFAVRLFIDIGGTGAKADNFVIWAGQFVEMRINWINHYEVQGQSIGMHLDWLRSQGYTSDRAKIWLPHDGETNDKVIDINYRSAFERAGYDVVVVPNQGRGAAMQRVERGRELFSRMWFDQKCQTGMDAISAYHPKIDEQRAVDMGPDHDWSSHSSDAFGLGCIAYEEPTNQPIQLDMPNSNWMTA